MSPATVYLARVFGLFLVALCLILAARPRASILAMNAITESPGLLLVTGVFTLAAGVACVTTHQVWSGGMLPIAVTLLGWVTLLKGALLVATPADRLKSLYKALHYPQSFRAVMLIGAAFGVWLSVVALRSSVYSVTEFNPPNSQMISRITSTVPRTPPKPAMP